MQCRKLPASTVADSGRGKAPAIDISANDATPAISVPESRNPAPSAEIKDHSFKAELLLYDFFVFFKLYHPLIL